MQCLLTCSTRRRETIFRASKILFAMLVTAFAVVTGDGAAGDNDTGGFTELFFDLTGGDIIIQQSRYLAATVAMSSGQLCLELNTLRANSSIKT